MEQNIKLTQEELNFVKELQNKTQEMTKQLGLLELERLDLKKRTKDIRKIVYQTQEQQQDFAKYLQSTYGTGYINTDTGEFTIVQE
jgi:hypothetical protein